MSSDNQSADKVAREMVGGPFNGELRAFDDGSASCILGLPDAWRAEPNVPEWACYRVRGSDDMVFVCRGSFGACSEAMLSRSRK